MTQNYMMNIKGKAVVLSPRNKAGIMKWRKKVGEEVATHIASKAAVRGSKVHKMCEDWLSQDFSFETWEKHKKDFLPYTLFNELKKKGNKSNEIFYKKKIRIRTGTPLINSM